jgi:hypothetical protein
LAGWATGDKIYFAALEANCVQDLLTSYGPNVALQDVCVGMVKGVGLGALLIDFDCGTDSETRAYETQREGAAPGEKIDSD